MSDTTAAVADELPDNGTPNLAEVAAEPVVEPVAEAAPEPEPEAEPKPEEPPKPKARGWEQRRIDELTKARREAERERDAYKALVEASRQAGDPEAQPEPVAPAALPPSEVERRAEQIATQREYQRQINGIVAAGDKEYGREFTDSCNTLADLGANDKPEFMQIVTDTENGHKLLQHLGQNPEEADRVLRLPPLKMAQEIARIADRISKPAPTPVSAAPAPIKPIDGNARVVKSPEDMTDDEWFEWRAKAKAEKRGARR